MVILGNRNKNYSFVTLDPESGNFKKFIQYRGKIPTEGTFSFIGGAFCALYFWNNYIYFRLAGKVYEFNPEHLTISWSITSFNNRLLQIWEDGILAQEILYRRKKPLEAFIFGGPFEDEEFFDIGLYSSEVLKNHNRIDDLLSKWKLCHISTQ